MLQQLSGLHLALARPAGYVDWDHRRPAAHSWALAPPSALRLSYRVLCAPSSLASVVRLSASTPERRHDGGHCHAVRPARLRAFACSSRFDDLMMLCRGLVRPAVITAIGRSAQPATPACLTSSSCLRAGFRWRSTGAVRTATDFLHETKRWRVGDEDLPEMSRLTTSTSSGTVGSKVLRRTPGCWAPRGPRGKILPPAAERTSARPTVDRVGRERDVPGFEEQRAAPGGARNHAALARPATQPAARARGFGGERGWRASTDLGGTAGGGTAIRRRPQAPRGVGEVRRVTGRARQTIVPAEVPGRLLVLTALVAKVDASCAVWRSWGRTTARAVQHRDRRWRCFMRRHRGARAPLGSWIYALAVVQPAIQLVTCSASSADAQPGGWLASSAIRRADLRWLRWNGRRGGGLIVARLQTAPSDATSAALPFTGLADQVQASGGLPAAGASSRPNFTGLPA